MHESWKIRHDRKRWNEVQELRSPSRSRQEQLSGRSPWYPDSFCWQGNKVLRRKGVYSAGNREPWLLYCIKELRRESDPDIQGIFQEKTGIDLCKIQIKRQELFEDDYDSSRDKMSKYIVLVCSSSSSGRSVLNPFLS